MAGSRADGAVNQAQPAKSGFSSVTRSAARPLAVSFDSLLDSLPVSEASEEVRAMPTVPMLHIHLLGAFRLLSADAPVNQLTAPRLQALLAYLVLHRDAP